MASGEWRSAAARSIVAALGSAAMLAGPIEARQAPRFDLIPYPAQLAPGQGSYRPPGNALIVLIGEPQDEMRRLGRLANEILRETAGNGPSLRRGGAVRPGNIVLRLAPHPALASGDFGGEGYRLVVTPDSIALTAPAQAGLFYGLQTLRQLVAPDSTIPAVTITDEPRFRWRGLHLDVGRHFQGVPFVKRYIDLLARYKLNTFHWHLTEDQGWRIQIRRYPRLTEVGSCRRETMVERNFDPFVGDGRPHCGFYTQDEIGEVVRYAAERFVTVVPEIEMPGHSVAALAAYPELACTPGPFEVHTRWGVTEDIYCPSEQTFTFLENVLREVMALFPSIFIHIGGDEVPKRRWRESPLAQEIIRRESLRNEDELQSWFIRRIERFLSANGRRLVGWDEILEGGLPPGATVMSWRGTAGGIAAARAEHDVIMSPTSHLYFDYYQGDPRFEPLAIGGLLPLERVYEFEPVPDSLTPEQGRHILGAQGNVWTEYLPTAEAVEFMAVPRMLALAEVVWSPREARRWDAFVARLPARLRELDRLAVNYRLPSVAGLEEDRLTLADSVVVPLTAALPDAVIRYTTDGSDPTPGSTAYTGPLMLPVTDSGLVVTARAFLAGGRASPPRAARFARTRHRAPETVDEARLEPGLRVTYHEADSLVRVAQLGGLAVLRDTVLRDVALPGFARAEHFALRYFGYLRVPADGIWRFRLASDDGSRLWIGERLVVDNDGLHGLDERSGLIALRQGYHPVRVEYFQRGGGKGLRLVAERDDGSLRQPVVGWLYRAR